MYYSKLAKFCSFWYLGICLERLGFALIVIHCTLVAMQKDMVFSSRAQNTQNFSRWKKKKEGCFLCRCTRQSVAARAKIQTRRQRSVCQRWSSPQSSSPIFPWGSPWLSGVHSSSTHLASSALLEPLTFNYTAKKTKENVKQ